MPVSKFLLMSYIISLPFMRTPNMPFLGQKAQYSEIIFIILFFYAIYKIIKEKMFLKIKIPFFLPLLFLATTFFISLVFSKPGRKDFIEYLGIVYLALLYILIIFLVRSKDEWYGYLKIWIWTSTFVCVLGALGYLIASISGKPNIIVPMLNPQAKLALFPKVLQFQLRVCSTFRNPNMLASYLITSTVFILLLIKKQIAGGKKNRGYIMLLCLHVLAALLTKSRGAGGTFLLVTCGLFIFTNRKKYRPFKLFLSLFTIFYFLLALVTVVIWVFPIQLKPFKINTKNSEYFLQSEAGFKMWKDYPFFGIGLGRYNYNLLKYFDWNKGRESLPNPDDVSWRTKDPHSTYFGWLAETGLMGLSAILILLWVHIKTAMRIEDINMIGVGIIAFLIAGFSMDILTLRYLWLLLGMNGAYTYISSTEKI